MGGMSIGDTSDYHYKVVQYRRALEAAEKREGALREASHALISKLMAGPYSASVIEWAEMMTLAEAIDCSEKAAEGRGGDA